MRYSEAGFDPPEPGPDEDVEMVGIVMEFI